MRKDPAAAQARDATLIARIRQGDERALTELARVYTTSLYAVAAATLGSRDGAKDILQDVLLALWDGRATLKISNNISGYLYRAVRNRALNVAQQERAQRRREERVSLDEADAGRVSWNTAEDVLEEGDLNRQLQRALEQVPSSPRQVFLLNWAGLTYEEIANMLGITRKSVRQQMYRATQQLARLLGR